MNHWIVEIGPQVIQELVISSGTFTVNVCGSLKKIVSFPPHSFPYKIVDK